MKNYNDVQIVLVEDSESDAELTIRSLKKMNLANNLIHLKDGAEALDFFFARGKYSNRNLENKPKVVLLDIKMPKVDGIEVLQQIKRNELTKFIPVVIMTSSKEQKDLVDSYLLGVNSYVVKPVDFNSFVRAVSALGLYWILSNQLPDWNSSKQQLP